MKNNIWQKVKISDVCDSLDNKRIPISKEVRKKGEIPYYGATGIVDYVKDYIFDEKLLLVGEDGADWSSNANTAYLIDGKSWVNNHAHVLRCTKINDIFLKEYVNYQDFSDLVGGSTRGKLTKGDLEKILIPFPSFEIQQKIASIISTVDEEIQKTNQIIQKTEKLKNGLMNELFVRGIENTKFKKTSFENIPQDWEIENLGDVLDKIIDHRGLTPKKLGSDWSLDGIPAISAMHVKGGKIINKDTIRFVDTNLYKKWMKEDLIEGDVLLTSEAPFGELYIVNKNEKFCLSQRLFGMRTKNYLNSQYFYYFLTSDIGQRQMHDRATGSTAKGIRQTELLKIQITVPSKDEQQKISNILLSLDEKLNFEKEIFEKLIKIKNGLMNDIFSQKVEVKQ